jgi:membrane AbrB-like protein
VVLTLIAFPVLLTCWVPGCDEKGDNIEDNSKDGPGKNSVINKIIGLSPGSWYQSLGQRGRKETVIFLWWVLLTLAVASGGGLFLSTLGVPAGIMVGAMLFTAIASLLGASMKAPTSSIFNLLLIGVGITISNSITSETLTVLGSGNLLLIILISTLVIFLSSLIVAYFISKVSGWDYATSFLAAAPAGFTVMTMLAVKYDKDPFRVSILHLCRLISLKVAIPLYFMFADKV